MRAILIDISEVQHVQATVMDMNGVNREINHEEHSSNVQCDPLPWLYLRADGCRRVGLK